MLRIGIPRAFYYYKFFKLWPEFFFNMGAEVVISPPTNKLILEDGIHYAVDEMCLPFKVYLGHIKALQKECDVVFVPRVVSVEKRCYTCPKVLGLPDIAKLTFPDINLFTPAINQYKGEEPQELIEESAKLLNVSHRRAKQIWKAAELASHKTEFSAELLPCDYLGQARVALPKRPKGRIALLGHSYNIYDNYTTMSFIDKLRSLGYEVLTSELIPSEEIRAEASAMRKQMFWNVGKELLGTIKWLLKKKNVDGIIYLSCFGCGADALIGEMVMRFTNREGDIPFLMLSIDEHSGEAGLVTRVEAFTDMLARRKEPSENNFPAHGEPKYSGKSAV